MTHLLNALLGFKDFKKPKNNSSLFISTGQVPPNKPPRVSDDFSAPRTAIKGERFVLECIVYGR